MSENRVPAAVSWGLLAAWILNDAEELATMARFGGLPQRRVNTAIGLMGVLVAAAAADGARTGGRSAFFRTSVAGFGLHGFTHLASAAVLRRYTPGLATAPTVVIPYAWWAARRLRAAGMPLTRAHAARGVGLLLASLGAVHAVAARVGPSRAWTEPGR
ncbi:HXXEE domain-containing protein [Streptomyces sp. NPDC051940]|uniref:HXXEE domain-containing protein n=1 Tax=Streptomyces sp. NPDC051940 TaxID=3155675 RepID=UPI0034403515